MTMLGTRLSRNRMLMLLMLVFTAGNVLSALAPSFAVLLGGRVITSFTHGAFFGIGAVVAAELVSPERRSKAVAFMFSGLALANLVGVPLGTWLGTAAGWRATFAAISVLGVLTIAAIALLVPQLPRPEGVHLRDEFKADRRQNGRPRPYAHRVHRTRRARGGTADLRRHAARAAARRRQRVRHRPARHGHRTPLQTVVLQRASTAPTLASAINIGAFNLGNAIAAWLGGLAIGAGFGYASVNWVGALMTLAGLGLAALSVVLSRQNPRSARSVAQAIIEQPG